MSRYRPERVPNWVKLAIILVLGNLVRLAVVAYVIATIWLVATGGFEGVL